MRNAFIPVIALVSLLGCSREEARQTTETTARSVNEKVQDALDIAVPVRDTDDPAARELERFDEGWRGLQGFREAQVARRTEQPAANIQFLPGGKESLKELTPQAMLDAPVVVPLKGDVSGPSVLKTQVYLDRANFSVGAIDGRWGRNSSIALYWFQRSRGVEATEEGALDEQTFRALATSAGGVPALVQHTLTAEDVEGPFKKMPEDVYEKAKLDCLCYESLKEKLAERFHSSVGLLETLNAGLDFETLAAGSTLWAPNVRPAVTTDRPDIARIVISIRGNTFNAFDAGGNLVFHAPTTLGSEYDPSPRETLEVVRVAHDPPFHYQPKLFHDVPNEEPEANLNPGPNSPVGVVWIALSKRHYGIHGTSDPESIGYASSHGCVRLTNWDAREVGHRVSPKIKVEFVDNRTGG